MSGYKSIGELKLVVSIIRKQGFTSFNGKKRNVNLSTPLYASVGIGHLESKSRFFHEALNVHYDWNQQDLGPIEVRDISVALREIRELDLRGLTVTIPHKENAYKYILEYGVFGSEDARISGAVNTIVNNGGILYGWNTDIAGFLGASKEAGINFEGQKVVVIGAGGMGRAAAYGLCLERSKVVHIYDLDFSKSVKLAEDLTRYFPNTKLIAQYKFEDCFETEISCVVQCTPVGMLSTNNPDSVNKSAVPSRFLSKNMAIIDAVYVPRNTKFIQEATKKNCAPIISGLDIVVHGCSEQIQLYLGKRVSGGQLAEMRKIGKEALLKSLGL